MTDTYEVTKEQYAYIMAKMANHDARLAKEERRKDQQKKAVKKYHQSEKGKLAKKLAQRRWREKQRNKKTDSNLI